MGIYLQVYNFEPDEKTQKPSGSIEYEIDKAGTERKADWISRRTSDSIPNASASQVTIEKLLPLSALRSGHVHHQGQGDRQEPEPDRPAAGEFYGKLRVISI